jgi:hypothetical protein
MPYPDLSDFANWSRDQQINYLHSTYGSIEDRQEAAGDGLNTGWTAK